jgi:CBS domain-containing protein
VALSIQAVLNRKGTRIITALPTETVKCAADRLREHSIAALVVMRNDAAMGVISERNIVYAVSRHGESSLSMSVADIMSPTTIKVSPNDTLMHVMHLMTRYRLRHLPVITDGHVVGIVSIGDVVKHRLEDLETESNVLRDAYIAAR